ncbi:hypothetical protein O181_003370 [Austropuccinia psidii MF-1]|uniref:Integrase catalytic domain-containing protein n=1 Tax=Austropuccinia psidii MF-1 TaxID=1389203 RepID=A0A9Q3BEB8_9BASI|nr:hypothetical protein [Austropuccinia psidii MF-1]
MRHRGDKETDRIINARFWWEGMKKSINKGVQSCLACQKRKQILQREKGKSTETSTLFGRASMYPVHIKSGRWKDMYGSPKEVTADGGPDFGKELKDEVKRAGSRLRVTTPYYPASKGMMERVHKQHKDSLLKMCGENGGKWKKYLPLVTLADRISNKRTTGFSSTELQFGQLPVLLIDIETKRLLSVKWHKIFPIEELLKDRDKSLEGREEMKRKATEKIRKSREETMEYWDRRMAHQLR